LKHPGARTHHRQDCSSEDPPQPLLGVEVLGVLLLDLDLLLLHNLVELVSRSLLVNLVLLLLVRTLRSTTGKRLAQEVLVLVGAPRVGAGALGDVGFTGGRHLGVDVCVVCIEYR
jgi:hypothetical protein